jgi:hypothetical protein
MKIWHVTEKTSVRATVNYEVRTNADRLREDYACYSALIQEVWLEDFRRNTWSDWSASFCAEIRSQETTSEDWDP